MSIVGRIRDKRTLGGGEVDWKRVLENSLKRAILTLKKEK